MINFVPARFEQLAVDLANTYDPCVVPRDRLGDRDALAAFLQSHDITYACRDLEAIGRSLMPVRDMLRLISSENSDKRAKQTLFQLISQGQWRVAATPESGFELVAATDSASQSAIQIAVLGALSLVTRHGAARIRCCKATPCEELFCDRSKSGRQVFCSKRCANRYGAARFRRRQADIRES